MFDFVTDSKFRTLLERDHQELKKCLEIGATKSVLVLAGSIIEASLIEYFIQFKPVGYTEEKIYQLTFQSLLDLGKTTGLLTTRDKNLAWVIKDYRNLIHPGKEIRKRETLNIEDAKIADALINVIIRAIEEKYTDSYGHTAKDVVHKLKNDWEYRSIYGKVILKLRESERLKLLELLVDNEKSEKRFWDDVFISNIPFQKGESSDLEFTKPFVNELKPLIPKEIIIEYLRRLLKEVESGEQLNAFCLYNLFHEELNYLDNDEIDTIATYMLAIFLHTSYRSRDLINERTFSTIGKYIISENGRQTLRKTALDCAVNFLKRNMEDQMDLFEQLFNGLFENERQIVQKEIANYFARWPEATRKKDQFYLLAIEKDIINKQ